MSLRVKRSGTRQSQVLCHCEAFEKRCGNLVRFVVVAMYNQNSNVIAVGHWQSQVLCHCEAVRLWQSPPPAKWGFRR